MNGDCIMKFGKILFVLFITVVTAGAVTQPAFAHEEGKTCHADTDCGHGEHCKEGHCHK
jgi:hypothetical protein